MVEKHLHTNLAAILFCIVMNGIHSCKEKPCIVRNTVEIVETMGHMFTQNFFEFISSTKGMNQIRSTVDSVSFALSSKHITCQAKQTYLVFFSAHDSSLLVTWFLWA